ncbi:MAG: histidinol dehydrogenase [Thermomicrobiales bacterium]|nr:histidinol dehydrogenase [Thermomicrobiales bacterium]
MTIIDTAAESTTIALPRLIDDIDEARRLLTRRRGFEETRLSPRMQDGIRRVFGEDLTADETVARILEDVRQEGDAAVREYSLAFQGMLPANLEVPRSSWQRALETLEPELQAALRLSAAQIDSFHRKQLRTSWMDYSSEGALGQIVRPLERIGIYTPGGTAVYPSSLLMTAIPARVAGVSEITVCSPSGPDGKVSPLILAAAEVANVDRLFAVGGAQAIGAMAYGTESIPHVDKILGPGNIFVVLAKQQVYGIVDIDQLPGPTETLLVADESADPALAAADMLAQAEHDPMATAILITCSPMLAHAVLDELPGQLAELERADIAGQSLATNGLIVITPDIETAIKLANAYAPEHLCLLLNNPWTVVPQVRNAGGIFIGEDSPEAIGDYTAGPSHVMPTGGTARFSSPINVAEFTKVMSVAALNRSALRRLGPATARFARAEGLTAHARAVERRLEAMANEDED